MKTLNDFISGTESVLTVINDPCTGHYIAFVGHAELNGYMASALASSNEDRYSLHNGFFNTDWFPVGFGKTIEEAIIDLNLRVTSFINDDGLSELYTIAYRSISNYLFDYDKEYNSFIFNQQFNETNFPDWLRKFTTIDVDKLYDLVNNPKGNFNA